MDELNYMVLYTDGAVGAMHIGDADDDEIFEKLIAVFKTELGDKFDNYETHTMSTYTADDVAMVINSADSDDALKEFASSLNGNGFEIFACWHEHGAVLHEAGFYGENHFLSGKGRKRIYGPVILRAQILQDGAVEVPVSSATVVAEMIVKAKGVSLDCIFTGQSSERKS